MDNAKHHPLCGKDCSRWLKRFKRCPKGAVSATSFAEQCPIWLPKGTGHADS